MFDKRVDAPGRGDNEQQYLGSRVEIIWLESGYRTRTEVCYLDEGPCGQLYIEKKLVIDVVIQLK